MARFLRKIYVSGDGWRNRRTRLKYENRIDTMISNTESYLSISLTIDRRWSRVLRLMYFIFSQIFLHLCTFFFLGIGKFPIFRSVVKITSLYLSNGYFFLSFLKLRTRTTRYCIINTKFTVN